MERSTIETCKTTCIHKDVIEKVNELMPEEEILYDLADFFKVLGDTTRIRILYALSESEMCVCDIASLLSMTQSSISHQLRILKASKLVKYRKDGKIVYYSLDDEHIHQIFKQGLIHITSDMDPE